MTKLELYNSKKISYEKNKNMFILNKLLKIQSNYKNKKYHALSFFSIF